MSRSIPPSFDHASALRLMAALACGTAVAAFPMACTDGTPPPEESTYTYYRDVKPLVDVHCVSCHRTGGAAPFALETYADIETHAASVKDAIEQKRMPPWLPDPDCHRYPGERVMVDEERTIVSTWIDDDMALGDEADAVEVEVPTVDLATPSHFLKTAVPYTPNPERPDDYRCMILDGTFAEDTWITGYQVAPDQTDIVHHVLLYIIPPESQAEFNEKDQAEEGEGFTCFSDPGVDAGLFGTWVPGTPATNLPNRLGFLAPAGSRVGVQVHYNLLAGEAAPDHSEVRLATTTTRPDYEAQSLFLLEDDFVIEAGQEDGQVTATFENTFGFPITIISTLPHMHLLGKSIRLDYIDSEGNEKCLVDIPQWDFNWQQTYDFSTDDFVVVEPGDATRISCSFDNSDANQPVVNGERLPPRDVTWGEGTLDEMCLMILTVVADRL